MPMDASVEKRSEQQTVTVAQGTMDCCWLTVGWAFGTTWEEEKSMRDAGPSAGGGSKNDSVENP